MSNQPGLKGGVLQPVVDSYGGMLSTLTTSLSNRIKTMTNRPLVAQPQTARVGWLMLLPYLFPT